MSVSRFCLVVLWGLLSSGSWAQDAGDGFGEDLFVIEGEVQKPAVVVVISRDNLEKGFELELRESFLDKVVEALQGAPF